MKFYCETYHEERDTEHCVFCSAACNQRPLVKNTKETEELLQDKEKKIGLYDVTMIDFHEDSITKKDLLNKLEEALDEFTQDETLHSITLRAIVRVEEKTH